MPGPRPAGCRPGPRSAASTEGQAPRETHQPDYMILVAVIALSAIGILMVFSSSAMKDYPRSGDIFGIVAPQVACGRRRPRRDARR